MNCYYCGKHTEGLTVCDECREILDAGGLEDG